MNLGYCDHDWYWVETELYGPWSEQGARHYACKRCPAWKIIYPDGSMTIQL